MTVEGVEVRRASEADVEGILALMESVAGEGRWIGTEAPIDRERHGTRLRATLGRDDAAILVAVVDTEVVGELGMYQTWPGLYDLAMATLMPWRGRGIGSRLMAVGLEWARGAGAHKIALNVFPDNAAAISLYEKFGFVREGYRPRHLRRKNGELWDVISMGLLLT